MPDELDLDAKRIAHQACERMCWEMECMDVQRGAASDALNDIEAFAAKRLTEAIRKFPVPKETGNG